MSDYVELLKRGGNEAIKINPPTGADFHITSRGSDWLFTVFCVNLLFGVILVPLMFRKPVKDRFVYYTAIAPNLFMSIAYFTMASNLGWIPVRAKYNHVQTSTPVSYTHLDVYKRQPPFLSVLVLTASLISALAVVTKRSLPTKQQHETLGVCSGKMNSFSNFPLVKSNIWTLLVDQTVINRNPECFPSLLNQIALPSGSGDSKDWLLEFFTSINSSRFSLSLIHI